MCLNEAICSCCSTSLQVSEVKYKIRDILRKWEQHGIEFSAQTYADYSENEEVKLSLCPRCGFGIFLPVITGTEAFYEDVSREDYYLKDRWDFNTAIKMIRSAKAGSVFDIGCGRGAFLARVKRLLPDVDCYGSDSNPAIRSFLPEAVTLFDDPLDAPNDMDIVTLFQVIEHIAAPDKLLENALSKLRSGGLLILSVPNHSGPIRFFANSHTEIPPHHVTQWTSDSIEKICQRYDLNIVARKTEPLPNYLMPFYLPKIMANAFGCLGKPKQEANLKRYVSDPIIHICQVLGVKSLPLKGHTFLLAATKGSSS